MGQRIAYLEAVASEAPHRDLDTILAAWPLNASFGLALDGRAARALAEAARMRAVSELVYQLVELQAVYGLVAAGATVRDVAAQLNISKSHAGRLTKKVTTEGEMRDLALLPPSGATMGDVQRRVLNSWAFRDIEDATQDAPRGVVEADPWQMRNEEPPEATNYGGTH